MCFPFSCFIFPPIRMNYSDPDRLSSLLFACSDLFQLIFYYLSYDDMILFDSYLQQSQLQHLYSISPSNGILTFNLSTLPLNLKQVRWLITRNITSHHLHFLDFDSTSYKLINKNKNILTSLTLHSSSSLVQINCPNLLTLTLAEGSHRVETVVSFLRNHPTIRTLNLSKISNYSLNSLFMNSWTYIQELTVSCYWFTDESIPLVIHAMPSLIAIDIEQTHVRRDNSIRDLLHSYPALQSLRIHKYSYHGSTIMKVMEEVGLRSLCRANHQDYLYGLQYFNSLFNIGRPCNCPREIFLLEKSLNLHGFLSRLFELLSCHKRPVR